MYNDVKRGPLANTIALHYFEEETLQPIDLFYFIESWIKKHGLTPSKMGGKGSKNITFARGKKVLEKSNFKGLKEQGIWIAALPPEDKIATEMFDFIIAGHVSYQRSFKQNSCIFCFGDQLIPWKNAYIKNLVKDLHQFLKPRYGYAFQRDFDKGPGLYPGGIEVGKVTEKEGDKIRNWGIIGLSPADNPYYKPFMIRDVYPLNFLSSQHLQGPIGDITLQEWIKEDLSRGTLEQLLPELWCWSVLPDNIEKIQKALIPHNILIAYMDF